MVQYEKKYKKNIVRDLRKRGFSYTEIVQKVPIPRSTLYSWVRDIPLTVAQVQRLEEKRSAIARTNARRRARVTDETTDDVFRASVRDIRSVSKRELWLMGIMLCWKPSSANGVQFTSGDPNLVKLFLKWLREVGCVSDEEILLDLFLCDRHVTDAPRMITRWSTVTGMPHAHFTRTYFLKKNVKAKYGLLRIRVRASSLLARQIAGWVRGIQYAFWGEPQQPKPKSKVKKKEELPPPRILSTTPESVDRGPVIGSALEIEKG